ncbi:MAG: Gfo/Idh/MocA family oxidoreductase [Alphaproteobacteria bacterium]|jgi:NADH-dependent dehydrogenase family|uniref:Gfo/Idh/MocA family oxidoreductase n=1 Tax=Candidatus Scatocola faecigallinarum TaxID=2840916 RepID=UPI003A2E58B0
MTKNIKVAVIGAGMMGKNHMKTYKSLNGVELVGVYDIFPEAAKAAAETFGIRAFSSMEEVAENVEAVSVVTTSVTHADVGEFFLNKGIHCMMEKPLACTEEECQRLISAAAKNNVVLLVGHIERFNPAVEQMGKLLSDTSKIRSLTAQRMSAASGRITDVDVSMDLMIHDVEVIQSLVKSPVVNIQAASVKTKESPMGKDYITALLEFENGATANITASRITQARVRTLTVTTDTNYIDMDFINQSINVHSQGRMPYVNPENIPEWMNYGLKGSVEQLFIPTNQPLSAELNHFLSCVRGEATPRISGQNALDALRVIWKIQEKLGFFNLSADKPAAAA